jgi:hypothetical protein
LIHNSKKNGTPDAHSFAVTKRSRIRNRVFGTLVMLISLLEEVASFAAIFLFVTALAFWSNILSTI